MENGVKVAAEVADEREIAVEVEFAADFAVEV